MRVGTVELANPVMTASGTSGHGAELAAYGDLGALGAVVVKSLAAYEWAGNPAPRVHPATAGMLNAVGLQGAGVARWMEDDLPRLISAGATVVASIWGRSVDDFRRAAELLHDAPAQVVAVEVNLSCPNLEGRRGIFAHDGELSRQVIAATDACGRPRWAKLSPNTDRLVEIADVVREAGADAVTLVNTVLGMALDPVTGRPGARRRRRWAVGPGDPPRRGAAPSTTCAPPTPTCRSSASVAWPAAGTRPSSCSPAPTPCRSARRRSLIRTRRGRCCTTSTDGAPRTPTSTSAGVARGRK